MRLRTGHSAGERNGPQERAAPTVSVAARGRRWQVPKVSTGRAPRIMIALKPERGAHSAQSGRYAKGVRTGRPGGVEGAHSEGVAPTVSVACTAPPVSRRRYQLSALLVSRSSLGLKRRTLSPPQRPGHMHHVDTYRLTCTCEAGRYGKRCWALVAALGYEDWRRRQAAQAAASSTRPAGIAALQDAF